VAVHVRWSLLLSYTWSLNADKPTPYEFLVQGAFVRTTLQAFLGARGLSTVRGGLGGTHNHTSRA
jgi:hypothetical protein